MLFPAAFVESGRRRRLGSAAYLLLLFLGVSCRAAHPGPPFAGPTVFRVGTSGDYAPFSVGSRPARGSWDDTLAGFDVALARAWAAHRGVELVFVPFRWPDLLADLRANRFDVAMSGVTVRPERSLAGRFTVPVAETGALALVPEASPLRYLADLERQGLTLAVNAGGHLERTARRLFPGARIQPIPENRRVLEALLAGRAEVALTDTQEAPHWQARATGLRAIGPLTRDRKAWLVRSDRRELAADLDRWLLAREADGTLGGFREEHLTEAGQPASQPLAALLAAIDERLELMPWVAEVKRRRDLPVRAPEREDRVIEAGLAAVRRATLAAARPVHDPEAVRRFYRAQIEAAVAVQEAVLVRPPLDLPVVLPDLAGELRPALLRIGERMARILVRLPARLDGAEVRRRVLGEVTVDGLPRDAALALADAIASLQPAMPDSPLAPEARGR